MDPAAPAPVGFLGLGALGRPIAERLLAAGHRLAVLDKRDAAMAAFAGRALAVGSPRDLAARCRLVFGCLVAPQDYRDTVLGAEGLAHGDALRLYVHLGTSGVGLVEELAAGLAARGAALLDAPVTGGPPRARAGTLTAMLAGPPEAVAEATPLVRAFASRLVHFGDRPGNAQRMKLLNNAVSLANLAAAGEAMVVGARAGLPAEAMLEVLCSGSAQSDALTAKIRDHVLTGRFAFGGALQVVIKDLELHLAEAQAQGLATPLAAAALEAYRAAARLGSPEEDMTRVVAAQERAAGVTLRAAMPAPA